METYLEKLKVVGQAENLSEAAIQKEVEKLDPQNPCVVCCVTMGKEPHVGHLFLLTVAEQIGSGVGSKLPVILINNNTGPRAASALVNIANGLGASLTETAKGMNDGVFDVSTIVSAYRSRDENTREIDQAKQVLDSGDFDIFAVIGMETEEVLRGAGYNLQVVSEAKLLKMAGGKIKNLSPKWSETGFTPFFGDKRIVVLEKAGKLTATGALLTSVKELSDGVEADLTVIVDSQPDVVDVTFVQTQTQKKGVAIQVFGAGVGLDGQIASGTRGEAMTIKELCGRFGKLRSDRSLKQAAVFLILTKPLYFSSKSRSLAESFYNFKDNQELLMTLVDCSDKAIQFKDDVIREVETLSRKVSAVSKAGHPTAGKFLDFLSIKSSTLLSGEPERVLAESKKTVEGVRQSYHFSFLKAMIRTMQNIESLKIGEFLTIGRMVEYCLTRIGL